MNTGSVRILMLSASLSVTGTHRILVDLIKGLDRRAFDIFAAYKPEFPGPGNDMADDIRLSGVEIKALRGRHLFSLDGLNDLYRIALQHDIEIIHCWDSFSIAARVIGRLTGAKVVETIGNPPVDDSWKNRMANIITSPLLDGLIFQSVGSREAHHQYGSFYLRGGCNETVIYNTFDLRTVPEYPLEKKVQIRNRYGFNEKDVILINLGMLNTQKSQEHLVDAMPYVLEGHPNVRLMIVGWGDRKHILQEHILSNHLENHVFLAGKRKRHDVFDILSISDIYVSSSLWEGLPIAVLEAMAFRLPVVATDVIGNRESVLNQETGLLVPPGNPRALSDAIRTLAEDKSLRNRMGENGRRRIETVFDLDRFIREHEKFYMDVLRRSLSS